MATLRDRYASILSACADWIVETDDAFVIRAVQSFAQPYPFGELLGTTLPSLPRLEDDREPLPRRLLAMLSAGEAVRHFDYYHDPGNEEFVHFRLDATPLRDGERVTGYVGSIRDVTQVVHRERAAARERVALDVTLAAAGKSVHDPERRLRDFADAGTDWFWELDEDLRFTYLSENAEVLSLYPRGLLYGVSRRQLLGDDYDRDEWDAHLAKLDAHEPFTNFEYRLPADRDGNPRWLRVSGVPIFDEGGAFCGYRGVGSDVTALYEARQRAREAEQHAAAEAARAESEHERLELQRQLLRAEKLKVVGQLTGGIAHDFNNLLAVVMTASELLQQRIPDDDSLRSLTEQIRDAAVRGARLTRRLLTFSRQQRLEPQVLRLDAVLDGMRSLIERTLGETIQIELETGPDQWHCLADQSELENALMNLAINARDAMPGGGTLQVKTSNCRVDEAMALQHEDLSPGDYTVLEVSDSGHGMTPELMDKVLEPFFTTKESTQGSGLGLSMIQSYARQSGGALALYSIPGQGTTARLYLPRAVGEPGQPVETTAPPVLRGHDERVLVVEDERSVREVVAELLENLGYRVDAVANGEAALAAVGQGVDVVLTDVVLGGELDGPAWVGRLREHVPDVPVIYMTGYSGGHRKEFLDPGVQLLPKPFGVRALAEALQRALSIGR